MKALVVLLSLLAGVAQAAPLDSTVVLRVANGGSASSLATGTVIHSTGGWSLVVTAGHLFRGQNNGTADVALHDGRHATGRLQWWTEVPDLALVSVPLAAPASPVAQDFPPVGSPVTRVGMFGADASRIESLGRFAGYRSVCVAGYARDGDSGGGVFNSAGELVAVTKGLLPGENQTLCSGALSVLGTVTANGAAVRETGCHMECRNGRWVQVCDSQPTYVGPVVVAPSPQRPSLPPPATQQGPGGPPGQTGPQGPPGPPGAACQCGDGLVKLNARLDAMSQAIDARFDKLEKTDVAIVELVKAQTLVIQALREQPSQPPVAGTAAESPRKVYYDIRPHQGR